MVLVDTTIWIALLRGHANAQVEQLRQLLLDGEALVSPVILQELLQGAASPEQMEKLRAHFLRLPILISKAAVATHVAAGALYARCRWNGITPRSPHDCLIAQTAIEHGVPLLHDDRDFEQIAQVDPRLLLVRTHILK